MISWYFLEKERIENEEREGNEEKPDINSVDELDISRN